MRLEVGGVYEYGRAPNTVVTYACVGECMAETVRKKRKKKVPGYKILVLAAKPAEWWPGVPDSWEWTPGNILVIPAGAHITVGVRRLD